MIKSLLKGFNFFVSKKTGETVLFYGHQGSGVAFGEIYVVEREDDEYYLLEASLPEHIDLMKELLDEYEGAITQRHIRKYSKVVLLEENKGKFIERTLTVENDGDGKPILVQKDKEVERVSKLKMGFYEFMEDGIKHTLFVNEIGKPFTVRVSRSGSCYGTIFKCYHCDFDVETYVGIVKASDILDELYLNLDDLTYKGLSYVMELKGSEKIVKLNIAWDTLTQNIYILNKEEIDII